MKLKQINEFLNITEDITQIESIELMYEIIKEHSLIEQSIRQAHARELSDIEKGYALRTHKNIPSLGKTKEYLANQWKETKLERLKNWKEKYTEMNNKSKKTLLDKARLSIVKAKPSTIKNLKRGGVGLAAAGMGYAAYKAFKKDKD